MPYFYTINVEKTHQHLFDFELRFVAEFDNPILEMPSWTPGSYLIRDYSRHVRDFKIDNFDFHKITKNNWQVNAKKGDEIICKYSTYAFDLSVRTSYLDNEYGLLVPASCVLYQKNQDNSELVKNSEVYINFNVPKDWNHFSSLIKKKHENKEYYFARNIDEFIDTPIGFSDKKSFESVIYQIVDKSHGEIDCNFVVIGDKGNFEAKKIVEDLKKLQEECIDMFGELPYDRYVWLLYVVGEGGGGLEHKYSNCSITTRWSFKDKKKYAGFLSLEAHEHFHSYNIKRIKPNNLGPFDYEKEVYTKLLWVAEGLTRFYDKLMLPRAGLVDLDLYYDAIAKLIKNYEFIPGRALYSLEDASFDAWIKLYKPDENTNNTYVSYYLKGGLVGLCLDLEIRKQTNWEKSLDDFYRVMYEKYKLDKKGYDPNKLQQLIENATNTNLNEFFDKYIRGVDEIDFQYYLDILGLELKKEVEEKETIWLGCDVDNKLNIKFVYSDSPAMNGGLYAKDKIIAINGYEVDGTTFKDLLSEFSPNDKLTFHVLRDKKLKEVKVTVSEPKPSKYSIKVKNDLKEFEDKRKQFFKKIN